jgi:large subunit ribosomal protein L4
MEIKVYGQDGTDTGRTVTLDASIFGVEPNDHAIWLDVRSIQANGRQGTHKAKERSEVAGSTRKLYRQKGTGNARAGDVKSPLRVGGGTIFGPRPRTYRVNVNRKTKQLARRSAFAYKAQADAIRVIEDLRLDAPNTRTIVELMKALQLNQGKVLLLTDVVNEVLYKSSRNLRKVAVRDASSVSTLDVINAQTIILQEGALNVLSAVLGRSEEEAEAETE